MSDSKSKTKEILENLKVEHSYYSHKPIHTLQDALEVNEELKISGEETKNLFLKDKEGNYYVYLSLASARLDKKLLKEITGKKIDFAGKDELTEKTGYIVGSAPSFPYDKSITYIVDKGLLIDGTIVCSGGVPTESYTMLGKDLQIVLDSLKNKIIYLEPK